MRNRKCHRTKTHICYLLRHEKLGQKSNSRVLPTHTFLFKNGNSQKWESTCASDPHLLQKWDPILSNTYCTIGSPGFTIRRLWSKISIIKLWLNYRYFQQLKSKTSCDVWLSICMKSKMYLQSLFQCKIYNVSQK